MHQGSPSRLFAFALAVALTFGLAGTSARADDSAQPSVLTILSGDVQVRHGTDDFAPGFDGQVLAIGDAVRTGGDGHAVVTLFEGSTVELEPSTQITIDDAERHETSTIIRLSQILGRTWHVVTHLLTPDSRYDVRTPTATASVRGTIFQVALDDRDDVATTTVTTVRGAVATFDATSSHEVLVTPGTRTTVPAGGAPSLLQPAPDVDHAAPVITKPSANAKDSDSASADKSNAGNATAKSDDANNAPSAAKVGDAPKAKEPESRPAQDAAPAKDPAPAKDAAPKKDAAPAKDAASAKDATPANGHDDQQASKPSVVPVFELPPLPTRGNAKVDAEPQHAPAPAPDRSEHSSGPKPGNGSKQH